MGVPLAAARVVHSGRCGGKEPVGVGQTSGRECRLRLARTVSQAFSRELPRHRDSFDGVRFGLSRIERETSSRRRQMPKVAKKSAKKAAAPKKAAPKKKARKPNAAFMRPVTPDDVLGNVVGKKPMPRTEVTKKLWDYIRKNGLQDAKNRRMINSDEKLSAVFGGKRQVSMFDMTKLVSAHLR
jgi:hypothetical protein